MARPPTPARDVRGRGGGGGGGAAGALAAGRHYGGFRRRNGPKLHGRPLAGDQHVRRKTVQNVHSTSFLALGGQKSLMAFSRQ